MNSREEGEEESIRKPLVERSSATTSHAWHSLTNSLSNFSSSVVNYPSISSILSTVVVALGTLQYGYSCGYTSGTQDAIMEELGMNDSEISSVGMTVSLALVAASFYVKDASNDSSELYGLMSILALAGVVSMVISFSIGVGGIPWVIMSETMHVEVKSLGGSLATLTNWFMAWLITVTANILLDWSNGGTFIIYAFFGGLTVLFVILCVPETKGKALEDIQMSFT